MVMQQYKSWAFLYALAAKGMWVQGQEKNMTPSWTFPNPAEFFCSQEAMARDPFPLPKRWDTLQQFPTLSCLSPLAKSPLETIIQESGSNFPLVPPLLP